jgi:hypothetical protein
VWDDAKRAWGYIAGAGRLLKRNPSLLLLPLALVVFSRVEGTAGRLITARYTAFGRAMAERMRSVPRPQPRPRPFIVLTHYVFPEPDIPGVTLSGTSGVVWAALTGGARPAEEGTFRSAALVGLLGLILTCFVLGPLSALLRGGYYGAASGAVASGRVSWRQFGLHARRLFLRFWILYAALAIVVYGLFWATTFPWRDPTIAGVGLSAFIWISRVAAFFLALAALVIVTDGCGALAGIRRGVLTVLRDIAVALVLAVGIGLVGWVVAYGFGWLRGWAWTLNPTSDLTQVHWSRVAVDLGQACIVALLSVVFVLAALTWYREAGAKRWPATAGTADERG